ncbi:MAG: tRNA (guanosine(18)-2'-O)-methyltransferase [Saprospiraceae bacterium]|nr:MAG: tRNA (guanosine(18)-2'-O)-methyltransferase [Saprospiraceae bacterium]
MRPEREARFREVINKRQRDLTIILENVHDQHNIGAALRSCDSVGIREIFVLYSEVGLNVKNITLGKRTSAGSRKWVDVHFYTDIEACFAHVRQQYPLVLSTHLSDDAKSLYDLNLTQPIALLFGNEKEGLSEEVLKHSDGNFIIPQIGMTRSLNVSVAVAVSVYEAFRQRNEIGLYDGKALSPAEQEGLFEEFHKRHVGKEKRKKIQRTND